MSETEKAVVGVLVLLAIVYFIGWALDKRRNDREGRES